MTHQAQTPGAGENALILAAMLREEFEDGQLSERGKVLLCAGLARIWPEDRHTVETCACEGDPERDADEPKCSECPTEADWRGMDAQLDRWVAANPKAIAAIPAVLAAAPTPPAGEDGGGEDKRPCTCHPDDNPPEPCVGRYALSECKAAAYSSTDEAVIYQFREIGEGEGWRACSKSNYDYFQRDPLFDTRTIPARSGQVLADENELLRATLERVRSLLENMAMEHETGWRSIFARWPIHHEPLRADARAVLPIINAALEERS